MIGDLRMECMDCNSDALFDMVVPGVYQLTIAHDETCPWFAQHQSELQS